MAGKLTYTLQEYQDAAHRWKSELLMLPILGSNETLQFMTGRPGIRYKESVGTASYNAQFGPYAPGRRSNENLKLDFRTLETFLGSVVSDFEPNTAISTLLGSGATKGDGQMKTPSAKLVLALMAQSLSFNLNNSIWAAQRNPNGSTTMDLFDGFDTITSKEITAGTIAANKGNYLKLTEQITKQNCCDVMKDILFHLDPHLRAQKLYAYCSQEIVDMYNESYQLSHGGLPYNTKYVQNAVEGSDGKLILVPLSNKADSKFIHITTKANMLYGYDNMSDETSIDVKEYAPFTLSFLATMFFGVQFETIDKRRFKVIELADPEPANPGTGGESGNQGGNQGGEGGDNSPENPGGENQGGNGGENPDNNGAGAGA